MRIVCLAEQSSTALPGWAPPALVGSAITACITLLVWYLNFRREPNKRITWEAQTQSSIVSIDREYQQRVGISYAGRNVSDLCAIRFKFKNTGNKVIKDHRIRLHFPGDSEILEFQFSPDPEVEFGASLVELGAVSSPAELACLVDHLEAGQEVCFEILVSGHEAKDWRPHSHNKEGDVEFREKSTERTKSDLNLVTGFLSLIIAFAVIPSTLSILGDFGLLAEVAARCIITIPMILILPAAVRALLRELAELHSADMTEIHMEGKNGSVIYNARSASMGSSHIQHGTNDSSESPIS